MRLCDLTVRLNDSTGHTVRKQDVTPAEILVLQAIHGESAVVDIEPKGDAKRTVAFEWDRLQGIYGRAADGLMDAGNGDLLERLFPGAISAKRLPVTMKDIGLGHLANPLRKSEAAQEPAPQEQDNGETVDVED